MQPTETSRKIVAKKFEKKSNSIKQTAEPLFAPKCRNCSGFEEKLAVIERNSIKEEVTLMHKHEIIRELAAFMGDSTECLVNAEELFDKFRYLIAEYVLKHEFNSESRLSVQMVLWLEQKCKPDAAAPLHNIINQYLSNRV